MADSSEFRVGELVRLLDRHGNVPSGSRGHIVGKFMHSTESAYIVSFEGDGDAAGAADVRFDEIVRAHDARASA